tara:strand:- start:5401 stop:6375 length:975 start_codon:yes stop_codon:yes gene_type:complete
MKLDTENIKIIESKNQLRLFGYDEYIKTFIDLFHLNKLPHTLLISGQKGLGKSTFIYHFINYLLSINEDKKYSLDSFTIDPNNKSYKQICDGIHPNFFHLTNQTPGEDIKIEDVRKLSTFLNKTTFSHNIRIVLIDNSEYLNVNSSNALLKSLEEPDSKTYFFIIHNSFKKILDTIKSRSLKFNIYFSTKSKKKIFHEIIKDYKFNYNLDKISENFYFDTPGNLLRYLNVFDNKNIDISRDKLSCIKYLIKNYQNIYNEDFLSMISFFIEQFYKELLLKKDSNFNNHFVNREKILALINDTKEFYLDKKNLFLTLDTLLHDEKR